MVTIVRPRDMVAAVGEAVQGMLRLSSRSLAPTAFAIARHGRCQPRRRFTTNLEREITRTIMATGPLSFARYMELCLQHPAEGYYARATSESDIIGAKGDFVTSPEISQHFGEIIGIWLLSVWNQIAPDVPNIRLVELGPGKGTLIGDVMRTVKALCRAPRSLTSVDLVESSAMLEQQQREALSRRFKGTLAMPDSSVPVIWHKSFDGLHATENEFTAVIAHELFDALPIHIIEKTINGWQEVLVDTVPATERAVATTSSQGPAPRTNGSSQAPSLPRAFRFVLSGPSLLANKLAYTSLRFSKLDLPAGTRIEVSPLGYDLARKVGQFISHKGSHGAALLVDYGDERFFGDSARAFYKHKIVDVFHRPGETDLTANVDFAFLKEAAAETGVSAHGPISQAEFLKRMGLDALLARSLSQITDADVQARVMKAAGRLVDTGPTGMGRQYQFLGLTTASADCEVYPFVKM
ncbi:DUF185-domain-containing protein [Auricularia subglabra TFB-10046 SS5]|nr:DUF185-domain-containing protein [Auricularia subglabra TFB-10046 SS5]